MTDTYQTGRYNVNNTGGSGKKSKKPSAIKKKHTKPIAQSHDTNNDAVDHAADSNVGVGSVDNKTVDSVDNKAVGSVDSKAIGKSVDDILSDLETDTPVTEKTVEYYLSSIDTSRLTVRHNKAYVWLLMKGDGYLPGIMVSVHSIARTKPDADLVVMCTADVPENAIDLINSVANVVMVPYLQFNSAVMKSSNTQKYYENWIDCSYTKWNMLALEGYEKCIFLDADTVILDNMDEIFEMKAPAAPFNSPFIKPFGDMPNYSSSSGARRYLRHGEIVNPDTIQTILSRRTLTLTANCVLLEPDVKQYKLYIAMMNEETRSDSFGSNMKCVSGHDELSISKFYADQGISWHNIHHQYNYIIWKQGFLTNNMPVVLHYISPNKPWNQDYKNYVDLITWYKMASELCESREIMIEYIHLNPQYVKDCAKLADTYISSFGPGLLSDPDEIPEDCLSLVGKIKKV